MTLVGALAIYFLPGAVLAAHQGVAHFEGKHVPQLEILGWMMPHWIFYPLVVLTGPALMVLILAHTISNATRL